MEGFITNMYNMVVWGESEALGRANTNHKNMSVSMSDCYHTAHLPQNNVIRKHHKALELSTVYDFLKYSIKPVNPLS